MRTLATAHWELCSIQRVPSITLVTGLANFKITQRLAFRPQATLQEPAKSHRLNLPSKLSQKIAQVSHMTLTLLPKLISLSARNKTPFSMSSHTSPAVGGAWFNTLIGRIDLLTAQALTTVRALAQGSLHSAQPLRECTTLPFGNVSITYHRCTDSVHFLKNLEIKGFGGDQMGSVLCK